MECEPADDPNRADGPLEGEITFDSFHSYLKQVVTVHRAMFEKLLFEEGALSPELAELFAEAGSVYLKISKQIEERYGPSDSMLNNILNPES